MTQATCRPRKQAHRNARDAQSRMPTARSLLMDRHASDEDDPALTLIPCSLRALVCVWRCSRYGVNFTQNVEPRSVRQHEYIALRVAVRDLLALDLALMRGRQAHAHYVHCRRDI